MTTIAFRFRPLLPPIVHHVAKFHLTSSTEAGHSKWANIRHIKALKDGQKSALFTKMARQIRLACQEGGSANPNLNSVLRSAIDEAIKRNMPSSRIQAILKKASADKTSLLKKQIFELKALNKVFMMCVAYTDNVTFTRQSLQPILKKNGIQTVDARNLFNEKGFIATFLNDSLKQTLASKSIEDLNEICTDHAIECEAEDIDILNFETKNISFICDPIHLICVKSKLQTLGYQIDQAEHVFFPKTTVTLSNDELRTYAALKDKIHAIEGIEDIFDNVDNIE